MIPLLLVYKYPEMDFVKIFSMGMLCYRQVLFNSPICTIMLSMIYMMYKLDIFKYKTKELFVENFVNNAQITLGMDAIEIYTEYEMYIAKLMNDVTEYYEKISNKEENLQIQNKIKIIKDGKEVYTKEVEDITIMSEDEKEEIYKILSEINDNMEYDFVIYEFMYNKERCNIVRDDVLDIINLEIKRVNSIFGVIELKMNNEEYEINIKSPVNYYFKDNIILDKGFIKYYFNVNNLGNIKDNNYELEILTNDGDILKLTEISSVKLSEPKCTIINCNSDSSDESVVVINKLDGIKEVKEEEVKEEEVKEEEVKEEEVKEEEVKEEELESE
jgi:hypothetical protein